MNLRALLLAVVAAAISGTLVLLYLRKIEVEASGGPPVRVLMAVKAASPGATLTDDMFATRTVPRAYVESRAILESDRARVVGLRLEATVKAQQTLMWTDLALATDDRRSLSDLVQPGMRAVAVRAADDQPLALVRPGDRVDLVANLPHPTIDRQRVAVLVAQNLLVLAVGAETSAEPTARAPGERAESVLSVSATFAQAQQIALASERGRITFALKARQGGPDLLEGTSDMVLATLYGLKEVPARGAPPPAPRGPIQLGGANP